MGFDSAPDSIPLPEEIIIPPVEPKTNEEGKKYESKDGGVFYGGDFLPKPPAEISIDDLPPPPAEGPNPVI